LGLTPDADIVMVMAEFDPPDPEDPEGEAGEPPPQLASATPARITERIHPVRRSKNLPPTKLRPFRTAKVRSTLPSSVNVYVNGKKFSAKRRIYGYF